MPITSDGNVKLKRTIIFNLPAISTCPKATPFCKQVCYAMKAQRQYPSASERRKTNFKLTIDKEFTSIMIEELTRQQKRKTRDKQKKFTHVRIHESGDFYNQAYVNKWVEIVKHFPNLQFLAYTKSNHLDFTELAAQPNVIIRYSVDHTSTVTQHPNGLPLAYIRTEQNEQTTRATIKCQSTWKCDECRLCWTSNKDVSFQLH